MTHKEIIEYLCKIDLLLQLKSRLVISDVLNLEFYRSLQGPLLKVEREHIDYLVRMFYKNIKPVLRRIDDQTETGIAEGCV